MVITRELKEHDKPARPQIVQRQAINAKINTKHNLIT
jgi:hypothetical protein